MSDTKPRHALNAIDKAISVFSPSWAVKRAQSRMQYNALASWDGAKRDRTNSEWHSRAGTADSHNQPDIDTLINRSRDLVRNTSQGRGVIHSYVRNVVGTGIRPHACATDKSGKQLTEFNKTATRLFHRWANNKRFCDAEKRLNFWDMQRQICRRWLEDGEVFIHRKVLTKRRRRKGSPFPLVIQRLEPDQLASDLQSDARTGNRIRRGIELDGMGAPVAYHFYDVPSNDVDGSSPQRVIRIPADRIDHIYLCERPGQSHGTPILGTVIGKIMQLSEFDNYEVLAAKVQACFVSVINRDTHDGFLGTGALSGDVGEDTVDARGNPQTFMEPAMILKAGIGEKVEGVAPTHPGGAYEPFTKVQLRQIAAACDISYEQLIRDFTQGTFSSQRQALLEDQRVFMPMQNFLIWHMCQEVWKESIELMVMDGRLDAPGFFADDDHEFQTAEWTPQAWGWIDPLKEATAEGVLIDRHVLSKTRLASRKGVVFRDEIEQIKRDRELEVENGLDPEMPEVAVMRERDSGNESDKEQPTNGRANSPNRFAGMLQ